MKSNYDIEVLLDAQCKLVIPKNNREINAYNVFESLDFSKNDTYILKDLDLSNFNNNEKEIKVATALHELYNEIVTSINELVRQTDPIILDNNDFDFPEDKHTKEEQKKEEYKLNKVKI